jgi:exopolysaccharide biosynthesis polyprenyl glycosylphosphotransferase
MIATRGEALFLLVGDMIIFVVSLWVALFVRYGQVPEHDLMIAHVPAFTILFLISIAVFYIAGLYEKHTLLFKSKLPSVVAQAQLANALIAVLLFYLVTSFGIAPKTTLFIYLIISSPLIFLWRIYGVKAFGFRKKEEALLIGSGGELEELKDEVNKNPRYGLQFATSFDLDAVESIDFEGEVLERIYSEGVTSAVVDLRNPKVEPLLPKLYNLIFSKIKFVDMHKVYEDIFDRVPLSLLTDNWFIENISSSTHLGYDVVKRSMDILIAGVLGIISLVFYPFVYIAIKFEDGGPIFFEAERVGQNNKIFKLIKFRSMTTDAQREERKITRVGAILRKTRIDELPQIWNVFKGDLSLVGPRPEMPDYVHIYEKNIPYYSVRHLIKPGLSGWAQIHQDNPPKFAVAHGQTKLKLSYDLYYIKNRSLLVDIKIALRTIKILLSRSGV